MIKFTDMTATNKLPIIRETQFLQTKGEVKIVSRTIPIAKRIGIRLSICAALFGMMTLSAVAQNSWNYRIPITISENTGGNLTYYQVLIRMDTETPVAAGKMNTDGSDIRFSTDSTATMYDIAHWVERYWDTDSTQIWVKVPSLPASLETTIYMFYGDATASSTSDFDSVFVNSYILDSSNTDLLTGSQYYDWFEVQATSTLSAGAGIALTINARKVIIAGDIDGAAAGFFGGDNTPSAGAGPGGGGAPLVAGGGGGGYGGNGGEGGYDNNGDTQGMGGPMNGSATTMSTRMGSGGGGSQNDGGDGGGAVTITGNIVEIAGDIDVSGEDGIAGQLSSGAGSGGGILIRGRETILSGLMNASGGDGQDGMGMSGDGSGGGSGGRIKYFSDAFMLNNSTGNVSGGSGGQGGQQQDGQAGGNGSFYSGTWTSPEPTVVTGIEVQNPDSNGGGSGTEPGEEVELWVPAAFSPNSDGKNDWLLVYGDIIDDFQFSVYNRWGQRVFTTEDMNQGWNGHEQNFGKELPIGAYVYSITGKDGDGKPIERSGMVNLIR